MTQGFQTLQIDVRAGVAVVTMARERVRNAFNEAMIEELDTAFGELGAEPAVRAIVLAARGPVFCAGADLEWMSRMANFTPQENRRDALRLAHMLRTISQCPKPTMARVHGDAYGGGVGLVASCDMAFGAADATFCLSETRLGLIPATIGPHVVRAIGPRAALRYFQTAETFDSVEALRIGLLHAVATRDQPARDARSQALGARRCRTTAYRRTAGRHRAAHRHGQGLR
jgi:methylglutaconyl-CoA hydratase